MKVERRENLGNTADDGGNTVITTTYTVPGGTNFYYANDAQVSYNGSSFNPSDAADQHKGNQMTQVDDFSTSFHVDPEFDFAFEDFSVGDTSVATIDTHSIETHKNVQGDRPSNMTPVVHTYQSNDDNNSSDNSGLDASSSVGSDGGGWT